MPVLTDKLGRSFEMREIDCPICGVDQTTFVGLRGGPHQRHGQGVPTRIVRCRICSLLYPNPFPFPVDPQELYADPEGYFARHDQLGKVDSFRDLARDLIGDATNKQASLLDIGSGRGELLQAARLEGLVDVVGLDFADAMIDDARERYGVETVKASVEEYAETADRQFDIVVAGAILEHVYDPDSFMAAVARLTRAGSALFIDTPREPNLLTWLGNASERLRGSRAVYNLSPTWSPYHVFGFSPSTLRKLLSKHGFEIDRLRVHSDPRIPAGAERADRAKAFIGTQLGRIANVTGTASNMFVWARRV